MAAPAEAPRKTLAAATPSTQTKSPAAVMTEKEIKPTASAVILILIL